MLDVCRNLSRASSSFTALQSQNQKEQFVDRLLNLKRASGLTFDEIASRLGVTNVYCAQLFHNQAQLKDDTSVKLRQILPELTVEDIEEMKRVPMRRYPPDILQDPTLSRFHEVVTHYGVSLKAVMSEKFGDVIMSAIDFTISVEEGKNEKGNPRVVVTMDGKLLQHSEQKQSSPKVS